MAGSENDNFQPRETNENSERGNIQENLNSAADLTNSQSNNSVREMENSSRQNSQDLLNSWNNFSIVDSGKNAGSKEGKDLGSKEGTKENGDNNKPKDSGSNDVSAKEQNKTTDLKKDPEANKNDADGKRNISGQMLDATMLQSHAQLAADKASSGNYIQDNKSENKQDNKPENKSNSGSNDASKRNEAEARKDNLSDMDLLAASGNSNQQGKSGGKPNSGATNAAGAAHAAAAGAKKYS